MPDPTMIILYVDSPAESAAFYADLFGKPPVEASPDFAIFELSAGVRLGLWSRRTVEPAATKAGGEIAISLGGMDAVDAAHDDWRRRGLRIAQEPTVMDFGHSFVALDPDGHRLRVFAPSAP